MFLIMYDLNFVHLVTGVVTSLPFPFLLVCFFFLFLPFSLSPLFTHLVVTCTL